MYVGGITRIIQTQIIKPVKKYFNKIGMELTLKVGAYTTNQNVNKWFGNSFTNFGLSINKSINSHKIKLSFTNWKNINHLIIDETSMVGCNMFIDIDLKLQTLKANIFPCRGLNIIFKRVFWQFPLVNDLPLCSTNVQLILSFTKHTQKSDQKSLWDKYASPGTIILIKQMNQVQDVKYSNMLQNICNNAFIGDDYIFLQMCFFQN